MVLPMTMIFADEKDFDEKHNAIAKSMDLTDRAAGIHNASNISLFFENYGKFSHDSFLYGDAGEFPANSNHNYLYLMSAMVGVAPDAASGRCKCDTKQVCNQYRLDASWRVSSGSSY